MTEPTRKVIFSGIQPTGIIHLGNYIGAVRNFKDLILQHDCIYCVVDMHAITIRRNPADLRRNCYSLLALYIACGLDPDKCTLFFQSHVGAHAELAWVLNCYTYVGELSRMTQFKDKSQKNEENVNMGLMDYPVLMAADILLYATDAVPVGADQKQHLELARDIAQRFNGIYGDVFTLPEPYIPPAGARIMSLTDPESKMSKSDENDASYVSLLDSPDVVRRKFRRAVTDSDGVIAAAPDKPGVTNLLTILSTISGTPIPDLCADFEGKGYGALKDSVADCVIAMLEPIQAEHKRLLTQPDYLSDVAKKGAEEAAHRAGRMLAKVYRKVGLAPRHL